MGQTGEKKYTVFVNGGRNMYFSLILSFFIFYFVLFYVYFMLVT